jgi:hypothetical protein
MLTNAQKKGLRKNASILIIKTPYTCYASRLFPKNHRIALFNLRIADLQVAGIPFLSDRLPAYQMKSCLQTHPLVSGWVNVFTRRKGSAGKW